jgi:hypothetical protein
LEQAVSLRAPKQPAGEMSSGGSPSAPSQAQAYAPQAQSPVVNITQTGSGNDSAHLKIVSSLLNNFEKQQEIMSQQVQASNKFLSTNEDQKDKYLNALIQAGEQKNNMMKQFIIIGGAVVLGVILVIAFLFMFVFHRYSKATEVRTLQATDAIAALLAAPSVRGAPMMITSTAGKDVPGAAAQQGVTMEMLSTQDPLQRAQAVEAVAAEIIEPEKNTRLEKIKKLEQLLKDENNRVRANAAKALYEIDKEESLKTLREMLASESNRMRSSAVWALGEIGSEDAFELITGLENENDEIVKYNMKVALDKVKSLNRFPMGNEQKERLEQKLKQFSDMV